MGKSTEGWRCSGSHCLLPTRATSQHRSCDEREVLEVAALLAAVCVVAASSLWSRRESRQTAAAMGEHRHLHLLLHLHDHHNFNLLGHLVILSYSGAARVRSPARRTTTAWRNRSSSRPGCSPTPSSASTTVITTTKVKAGHLLTTTVVNSCSSVRVIFSNMGRTSGTLLTSLLPHSPGRRQTTTRRRWWRRCMTLRVKLPPPFP